jgi:hypothetical protein
LFKDLKKEPASSSLTASRIVSASDAYQQFEFAELSRQKSLTQKAFLNEKAAEHDQNMKQLLDEHLINSKKQKHELDLLEL